MFNFAQTTTTTVYTVHSSNTVSPVFLLLFFAILVFVIACMWRVFSKAGEPGWKALIPIYNTYTELKIVNRPGWWLLLFFIPIVNFVIAIIVILDLAKAFGKGVAFAIFGLLLFPYVGFPMLAFGDAKYTKPADR